MTYLRVIPRDLFNEASLLKCLGQVYLELESGPYTGVELRGSDLKDGFDIEQDPGDGSISVANIRLQVSYRNRKSLRWYRLKRPLNARRHYPLYLVDDMDDDILVDVLTEDGEFSAEMKAFLKERLG